MHRHLQNLALGLGASLLFAAPAQATIVVHDQFSGTNRHTLEDGRYYWWHTSANTQESDGLLYYTGGVDQVQGGDGTDDPNINFFDQPLTFSVRGLQYRTSIADATAPTGDSRFYFGLVSNSSNWAANDGVIWDIRYDGATDITQLRLAAKVNAPNAEPIFGGSASVDVDRDGALTGFDLTISTAGYAWTIYGDSLDDGFEVFTGDWTTEFTLADWSHSSGLGTANVRIQYSSSGSIVSAMDELFITQVPEPTSLALMGVAGAALIRRRRGL